VVDEEALFVNDVARREALVLRRFKISHENTAEEIVCPVVIEGEFRVGSATWHIRSFVLGLNEVDEADSTSDSLPIGAVFETQDELAFAAQKTLIDPHERRVIYLADTLTLGTARLHIKLAWANAAIDEAIGQGLLIGLVLAWLRQDLLRCSAKEC